MEDEIIKTDGISYKKLYVLAVVMLACAVIPIWYLGRYDVTSLDDFYFGKLTYQAWKSTHSIGAVFNAAIEQVKFYYGAKQATYSSVFLMSFYPGAWNERAYFLTPFIMSGMIMASVTALVHVVIMDCMGVGKTTGEPGTKTSGRGWSEAKYVTGIINALIIFVILQTIPVPLEGIFWYNGSLHYVFMQSLMILEAAVILHGINAGGTNPVMPAAESGAKAAASKAVGSKAAVSKAAASRPAGFMAKGTDNRSRRTRIICIIVASLIGIIVGGGNLITGLQACLLTFIHVCVMIAAYLSDKKEDGLFNRLGFGSYKKEDWAFMIPEAVTVIGYLINITAPGNANRQESVVQMNPVKAVIYSFYYGVCHAVSWMNVMMVAVMIVAAVALGKLAAGQKRRFIHPLFMGLICICIFAAMFTPTFYAMSEDVPSRVQNVIYVVEVLLIFINLSNGAGYVWREGREKESSNGKKGSRCCTFFRKLFELTDKSLPTIMLTGIIAVGIIFVFAADKNTYVSMSAVRSIANGEAARYYEQSMDRFEILRGDERDVVIKAYTGDAKPYLLFKEDVDNAPGEEGYWLNLEMCGHYDKDSITVVAP